MAEMFKSKLFILVLFLHCCGSSSTLGNWFFYPIFNLSWKHWYIIVNCVVIDECLNCCSRWQFTAGIVDTGGNLPPALLTPVAIYRRHCWHRWQFTAGIVDTGGNLSPALLTPVAIYRRHCWHRWQFIAGVVDTNGNVSQALLTSASNCGRRRWQFETGGKITKIQWHSHFNLCFDDGTLIK